MQPKSKIDHFMSMLSNRGNIQYYLNF